MALPHIVEIERAVRPDRASADQFPMRRLVLPDRLDEVSGLHTAHGERIEVDQLSVPHPQPRIPCSLLQLEQAVPERS